MRVQLRERPQVREEKSQSPPGRVYQPVPRPGGLLELDGGIVQVESVSVQREGEYLRLELRLRRVP